MSAREQARAVGVIPEGEALAEAQMPVLSAQHTRRLRFLWSYGRPVHVRELTGIDLDLQIHGMVQPVDQSNSYGPTLTITRLGIVHLSNARQAVIATQQPHHELGRRLAAHLRAKGMWTWENVAFSNPAPEGITRTWGTVRPDVFACLPTFRTDRCQPAIYEVKVSRADFLADMAKPEKRQAYLELAQALYYCCPNGLIAKSEVPKGIGLLYEHAPGVFVVEQRATRPKGFRLAADTVMTLAIKGRQDGEDLAAAGPDNQTPEPS